MQFKHLIFFYSVLLIIFGLFNITIIKDLAPSVFTPLVFGGIIFIMGIISINKDFVLFGQHGATAISLIAFITTISGYIKIFEKEASYSDLTDVFVSSISLVFLILAVRQFGIDRKRINNEGE